MNVLNILLTIIFACMFGQLSTISHEFGHAIPALLFSKDKVTISYGSVNSKAKKICFGRLHIRVGKFQPFFGIVNWYSNGLTTKQKIIIYSGGPIISLFIGLGLLCINGVLNDKLFKGLIYLSASLHIWQFVITSIPIIYPKWWFGYRGYHSDGCRIMSIIKGM